MKRINDLESKIQKEIWRIQMIDYPTSETNNELIKMQKELKELKRLNELKELTSN